MSDHDALLQRWIKADEANNKLKAELAEWQRHGVKVTEDCETCGGTGDPNPPCDDAECALDHARSCPDCGGTGKKLRDGVRPFGEGRHWYVIPAEWLEAR